MTSHRNNKDSEGLIPPAKLSHTGDRINKKANENLQESQVENNILSKYVVITISSTSSDDSSSAAKKEVKKVKRTIKKRMSPSKRKNANIIIALVWSDDENEISNVSGEQIRENLAKEIGDYIGSAQVSSSDKVVKSNIAPEILEKRRSQERFKRSNKETVSSPNRKKLRPRDIVSKSEMKESSTEYVPEKLTILAPVSDSNSTNVISVTRKGNKRDLSHVRSFVESFSGTIPAASCHPEATYFMENFQTTKDELTVKLFKIFNETIFENRLRNTVRLEWNPRLRSSAGSCYYCGPRHVRSSHVELSAWVCDSAERVRNTLVHELCHAAVWIVDGKADSHHGKAWKAWATKAMSCFPGVPISAFHEYDVKCKYTYTCTRCGYSVSRHTMSIDTPRRSCDWCSGDLFLTQNFV